jgi:hypothetical protein
MVSIGKPVVCSTLTSEAPGFFPAPWRSLRPCVHHVHVVTEDLDRHVAAHPGDQLVETHLDGLGELVVVAGTWPRRLHGFTSSSSRVRLGSGQSSSGLSMT